MKNMLAFAAAVSVVALTFSEANAWQRHVTVTGPRGNSRSVDSSGSCAGGTCTYSRAVTGPGGRTRTISGSAPATKNPDGSTTWSRGGTATGPNGGTVTYGSSGRCSGGTCTYQGGATGPSGGTTTRSGTASR